MREKFYTSKSGKEVWIEKEFHKDADGYVYKVYGSNDGDDFLGNYKSKEDLANDMNDGSIFENAEFMESFILDPVNKLFLNQFELDLLGTIR